MNSLRVTRWPLKSKDPPPISTTSRDAYDNDYLIHPARVRQVDLIVSGDADLLEWVEQNPTVMTPADFEERIDEL